MSVTLTAPKLLAEAPRDTTGNSDGRARIFLLLRVTAVVYVRGTQCKPLSRDSSLSTLERATSFLTLYLYEARFLEVVVINTSDRSCGVGNEGDDSVHLISKLEKLCGPNKEDIP